MSTTERHEIGKEYIPEQEAGSEMNAVSSRELDNEAAAKSFYLKVKQRLVNVNSWYEYAELPLSSFKLFDSAGRAASREAQIGDYIRIDIPGPGTSNGDGYDWVVIEKLAEQQDHNAEAISMVVRPAAHPLHQDQGPAHFFKESATSTFQIRRIGFMVLAEEHGRNEQPNTETGKTLDNIRNALVGISAKIGFSYPQWKSLVRGLIK